MLDKCEEGTRYKHRKQIEGAIVPNAFSVASARRDERESRESRPGFETNLSLDLIHAPSFLKCEYIPKCAIC